jgi:hypothetical protein
VAAAAPKPHIITFGKERTVQWFAGAEENKPVALKVRVLLVGGRLQEYTLGPLREITDRLFVVRRAFRVNDSPPQDSASPPAGSGNAADGFWWTALALTSRKLL